METHSSCSDCEGRKHHWLVELNTDGTPYVECKHCDAEIAMAEQTTFIETSQGSHTFYFVCEGCGSEGVIDFPIDRMLRQFSCPEECGASYIAWTNPIKNAPNLKCVVCPVFEEA